MNRRQQALTRLEQLGPSIRRRLGESERHSALLERFGGVTLHQLGALRHLVRRGPLTMNELAAHMAISPSSTTQLVDRLVQHGLVERMPDPSDRRVLHVTVSESASATVRDFEKERSRQLAKLLAPLSEQDLETLALLAERIVGDE